MKELTGNFTRPADTTAYASGDLVANSTTAGSVAPMQMDSAYQRISIRRARLWKSTATITNASFRIHLYNGIKPTPTNGDNGVWLTDQSATYLGFIDIVIDKVMSDGSAGVGAPSNELNTSLDGLLTGQTVRRLFALIEARAAYVPASAEVFNIAVEIWQEGHNI